MKKLIKHFHRKDDDEEPRQIYLQNFPFSWAYATLSTRCNAFNGILNVQVLSLITSNTR